MSIDPVCGMEVDQETAKLHTTYEGSEYYFCSESCLSKFTKSPSQYLPGSQPSDSAQNKSDAGL